MSCQTTIVLLLKNDGSISVFYKSLSKMEWNCQPYVESYPSSFCDTDLVNISKYVVNIQVWNYIWGDFNRASSLICGNKMLTVCNRWFLLQILLPAQHVSGTIMPIIRSSRVLYRWLLPVVFGSLVFKLSGWRWPEGYVSGLRAWKSKHQIPQAATSSSWWWA